MQHSLNKCAELIIIVSEAQPLIVACFASVLDVQSQGPGMDTVVFAGMLGPPRILECDQCAVRLKAKERIRIHPPGNRILD
jgi:hypothetical protein